MVAYIESWHHEEPDTSMHKNPVPNEPGVSTQLIQHNNAGSTEAPCLRNETDGSSKKVHGTVVETVEDTEDRVTRQVA